METTERPAESVQTVAARWAVRLDAGPLPPEEQHALEQWLAIKPQHQGALVRACAAWTDLDRVAALSPSSRAPDLLANEGPADRSGQEAGTAAPDISAEPKLPGAEGIRAGGLRYVSLAAGLAAAAVLGTLWFGISSGPDIYTSAVGEIRRVTLSDGSSMVLNTATEARVRFTDAGREILLTRGEALFDVARDPAHPFVVRAGDFSVKALGTAFVVRIDPGNIDVTVTAGLVEVQGGEGQGQGRLTSPVRLAPHHRAILSPSKPAEVLPITARAADRQLAWRNGMVSFDGESLAEAIAQVNRHNRRHIVVRDSALAQRPVVGLFKATDPQGFAHTAATALGAQVTEDGETIVILATTD